jgi:hypothetical protein
MFGAGAPPSAPLLQQGQHVITSGSQTLAQAGVTIPGAISEAFVIPSAAGTVYWTPQGGAASTTSPVIPTVGMLFTTNTTVLSSAQFNGTFDIYFLYGN